MVHFLANSELKLVDDPDAPGAQIFELKRNHEDAKAQMSDTIRQLAERDIGGDRQRVHSVMTDYREVSFKHVLLPVWIATYRYNDKPYRFLVNARTGEVRRVDGFQYVLQAYSKQLPDDFIKRASLVDAVFCILLGNANQPLSAAELGDRVQRAPDVILKTLGGRTIYQGIRPVLDE